MEQETYLLTVQGLQYTDVARLTSFEYHCGEVDVCQSRDQGYTDVAHFNFSDDHTVVQLGGNPVYTGGELVGVVCHPRAVHHIPTQVLQKTPEQVLTAYNANHSIS